MAGTVESRPRAPCRLIIHADDLGISEHVNQGIARAYREGVLTSASIMAVGRAFDHAVQVCLDNPGLDIGLHLTLIEERPLSTPASVPTLVDARGCFRGSALDFTRSYLLRQVNLNEVYLELDSQIRRVRDAGLAITHLDSHQHVHVLPGIFDVTVQLARAHGIRAVRLPRETLKPSLLALAPSRLRAVQQLVLNGFCLLARRKLDPLLSTDHFAGFLFGGRMDKTHLDTVLRHLPRTGVVELMCHPAAQVSRDPYVHWGYRGPAELEALVDPELPGRLSELGIQAISYRDLIAQGM